MVDLMDGAPNRDTLTARDVSARWWRQVGFWGVTVNAVLGFWALLALMYLKPEEDWSLMQDAYSAVLLTFAAAAGIRQAGKWTNSE